jgi:hypothetical protein
MAIKKGGAPKARKRKALQVRNIKEIVIEVPHDAAKRNVHELVKTALHHKSVTDAVETMDPVVVQLVDNGSISRPWPWPWPKPKGGK